MDQRIINKFKRFLYLFYGEKFFKRNDSNILNRKIYNFKNIKFKEYYYNQNEFMNIISVDKLYDLL